MNPDFWKLIAGLGLFLYGMFHLEDTMKQIQGRKFKLFLQKNTQNKIKAIFSGLLVTAVLQSSSIVNLIVLSFVGAGVLSMRNAMAVVLGANIGGTFNSWLVALIGFGVNLNLFTLPFIGIGGIAMILLNKQKIIFKFAQLTLGLGLLFLGLQFMKESMNQLLNNFNFTPYLSYPLIAFVLFGFIITAIIQTSAATVVLVLTAIYTKVLPIETGVAVVLGAELGTTIKLALGSVGGIPSKKRVALGNILFNILTSLFGFIFLVPIINILNNKFGIHDPIFILVAFQTFINITGVLLIYFFINGFVNFLEKRFITNQPVTTSFLQHASLELPETAVELLEKEVGLCIYQIILLNMQVFQLTPNVNDESKLAQYILDKNLNLNKLSFTERYLYVKETSGKIISFYSKFLDRPIKKEQLLRINQLVAALRNGMYAAKGMKDIHANSIEFSNSINDIKFGTFQSLQNNLTTFFSLLISAFNNKDQETCFNELKNLYEKTQQEFETSIKLSYQSAGEKIIKEKDISTLINLNRALFSSCKAILFAVKDFQLTLSNAEKLEDELRN